jgi:glycosyltransferase involved in cell wall biosynthesis
LLRVNKKGVTVHGWVSKKILREAWKKSEYWLYPCIFEETFCLTALEAASSKTCVISNDLAALKETVGDRGFIVEGDPNTEEWQTRCIDTLFNLKLKEELIEKNYQWSKKLTWDNQTEILLKKIYLKN